MGQRRAFRRYLKYSETNKNENTSSQNLWDAAKVLRGKFIALKGHIKNKKELRSFI